jgi:hypothetical protein
MYKVLDVGSGGKGISLPPIFSMGFELIRLDVNPEAEPDILCDLISLPQREELHSSFDAVYASHILEHFSPHETIAALRACATVLKPSGFALFRLPSIELTLGAYGRANKGLLEPVSSILPHFPTGVTGHDIIFGLQDQGEWMKHKRHFTMTELKNELSLVGFNKFIGGYYAENLEILAICYKDTLDPELRKIIQSFISD